MTNNSLHWSITNHIEKFADDTTVFGLIQNDNDLANRELKHQLDCCRTNILVLNVNKTNEIIVDFKRSQPSHTSMTQQLR